MSALHADTSKCYFCEGAFEKDKYDMYTEEVGEFWNVKAEDSVLAHPDCTPMGIDAIITGEDKEWKLA